MCISVYICWPVFYLFARADVLRHSWYYFDWHAPVVVVVAVVFSWMCLCVYSLPTSCLTTARYAGSHSSRQSISSAELLHRSACIFVYIITYTANKHRLCREGQTDEGTAQPASQPASQSIYMVIDELVCRY